ncbi:methyl-accepting chemotaxis protein [Franzmannia pantelleriensis]|uniref:Methyl-accepting chemotaxis protein n=1 Tax=Franzmannia pantelleriensis TaxID=48727 RepID=A0A1G9FG85_9GAMM|nr:methyl-accepting chemotaxis protein [Halomonas pantelleriensis]SDK87398.1 methyl-accepting chemotaxis protein [Halomonas pantelleriensis]
MGKLLCVGACLLLAGAAWLGVSFNATWSLALALSMSMLAGAGMVLAIGYGVYAARGEPTGRAAGYAPPLADYRSLKAMAYRLMDRASRTAIASAEVSHHADRMDHRLARQDQVVKEAVASMQAITTAIEQVTRSAQQVAELAGQSRVSNAASRDALAQVIEEMRGLAARSEEALGLLTTLSDKSERVRHVTGLIEDIAEQTNLLSLNASIEAARAGEHGRGFAVVAGEVRELARRTSDATQQVENLVGEIGDSSQRVVETIGHLMQRVGERAREVETVGEQLGEVTHHVDSVEAQIGSIAEAMADTNGHSQQVAGTLQQLDVDTAAGTRDMHDLAEQARALMDAAEGVDAELALQHLDGRHQQVLNAARLSAKQIGQLFEHAIKRGDMSLEQLFAESYEPLANTRPVKYRTHYDRFTDRHLPDIQEPLLESLDLAYAITCDRRGYVPTHNRRVSQPPTGDYQHDLHYSRSKRMFDDPTGSRCGAHQKPLLLQTYKRDTGEVMHDLSVPIFVQGRHWGGFRIGYQPAAQP